MRIAIVGGSFDPPTQSHLVMGEVVSHLVDRVCYVPTGHSPLKDGHHASAADRLHMIKLATKGNPHFEVCDRDVNREGRSYMLDTLRWFRDERHVDPVPVIGSDCYRELHRWSRFDQLLEEFELIVVSRVNHQARNRALRDIPKRGVVFVSGLGMGLSSTLIRARLSSGSSCRYLVPEAVLSYIVSNGLYGVHTGGDEPEALVGGVTAPWWTLLMRSLHIEKPPLA